jgi:hypothetical protein
MAEDIVVKEQLTDAMVDTGAEITRKLDEMGLPIEAALWFFMPEINEWRLLFASSDVITKGPRDVYRTIRRAIDSLGANAAAVPFSVVGLLDSDSELLKLLRVAVRTGQGISRVRFSKNTVNGHFIDDALIYRVS